MNDYNVYNYQVNGFTVDIEYELDAQSPHEWELRGADMVLSLKNYDLPNDAGVDTGPDGMNLNELVAYLYKPFAVIDEDDGEVVTRFATEDEASACIDRLPDNEDGYGIDSDGHAPALLVLPVYGYIHSGIALRAGDRIGQFADPWDSGTAGVAYVTPKIWEYLTDRPWTGSDEDVALATEAITSHVSNFGHYLNGDVYEYRITDWDGEYIDSCSGFYDIDEVMKEANASASREVHEPKCTGTLERASGIVVHDRECPIHT